LGLGLGARGVPAEEEGVDAIEFLFLGEVGLIFDGLEGGAEVGEFVEGGGGGGVVEVGLGEPEAGAAEVIFLAGEEEFDEGEDGREVVGGFGGESEGGFGGEFEDGLAEGGEGDGEAVELKGFGLGIGELFGLAVGGAAAAEAADAGVGEGEAELEADAVGDVGVAEVVVEEPGFEGLALAGGELGPGGITAEFGHGEGLAGVAGCLWGSRCRGRGIGRRG